ncbi:MAG: hypothetical protein KAU50_06690 [Candidatus Marinimicrobia bacterium]|nr:hypothetical protein [Candidatus Neomarinimicrobiota bacterium]
MTSKLPEVQRTGEAIKDLLLASDHNLSELARQVGYHPSSFNRFVNEPDRHLPAFLIPHLPEDLRHALLHYLDNQSGNPLKGGIDTSRLDGSIKDEVEGIVERLGLLVHADRHNGGSRNRQQKLDYLREIQDLAKRAEHEIERR